MTPDEIAAIETTKAFSVCASHEDVVTRVNRNTLLHTIAIALEVLILIMVVG